MTFFIWSEELIGIDARVCQRVVLFFGHREHKPMGDHGTFRGRRKLCQMLSPGFGNALLTLCVGKLRGRRADAVRTRSDAVVQESAGVDLSKGFLRGIVGEVLELFVDLLIHLGPLSKRTFSAGGFIKILQVEVASRWIETQPLPKY
jgi:hypothetical protein